MAPPWLLALPWLGDYEHAPTDADVEELAAYFAENPAQVGASTEQGQLPLHMVCAQRGGRAVAMAMWLLKGYPVAAQQSTTGGWLALHVVLEAHRDENAWTMVVELLLACPEGCQAAHATNDYKMPLHFAAKHQRGQRGVDVVLVLLQQHPDGAQQKDENGWLPLHTAIRYQTGEHGFAIVSALLAAYPAGAHETTFGNWLPLHLAARHQQGEHGMLVMTALLAAHPLATEHFTCHGWSPLHYAASSDKGEHGVKMVKLLLEVCPRIAQNRNTCGNLPLHYGAGWQKGEHGMAMVMALLEACPQSAWCKGEAGWLPSDFAQGNSLLPAACLDLLKETTERR